MIGDVIKIKPAYVATARAIAEHAPFKSLLASGQKIAVCIGGESGSGKSVTAVCLSHVLDEMGVKSCVLHQDDYFFFPPRENHLRRLEGIEWVGVQEVDIHLLNDHITRFKSGVDMIDKPLSDYDHNVITKETLNVSDCTVLIVEGTYALFLEGADYRVFMERNYKDTRAQRIERARDVIDEWSDRILDIEHRLIAPCLDRADAVVAKDYKVKFVR